MEYFSYKNKVAPGKGRLLVSEPYLPDPNFERTIILLCEHNDDGSFGFIMNKPSLAKLGDIMADLKDLDAPVFIGGPVQQDTLHYIHRVPQIEESIEIVEGIYWGGNFDQLVSLVETKQIAASDIKFFLGYSGWSFGQIDEELKEDSWIVSDHVNEELLFDIKSEAMWQYALKRMGGRFSVYSNYPMDPRLN